MKRLTALLAVPLLALAACSSDDPPAPESASPGIEGGQDALDAEASANEDENAYLVDASETAEWGNGLTAKITSVTTEHETSSHYTDKGHDTTIQITVEITNTGNAAFAFADYIDSNGPSDHLYYGVNLYDAQAWAGNVEGLSDLPQQLVPGTSTSYTGEWSLPADGLASLTFEFTPARDDLPAYVFTGVESLLPADAAPSLPEGGQEALDALASANPNPPPGPEAVVALQACVAAGDPCGTEVSDMYAAATVLPPETIAGLGVAVYAYLDVGCLQGDEVPECGSLAEDVLAEAELLAE